MARAEIAIAGLAVLLSVMAQPVAAEVFDADYRGTLVCDKLPFTDSKMREAIGVVISGGSARYTHIVRLYDAPEARPERGEGTMSGQNIALKGAWDGNGRQYKASYSGTFVRRSARLKGTQSWTADGKTFERQCSGAIKRPLKAFIPRQKKT